MDPEQFGSSSGTISFSDTIHLKVPVHLLKLSNTSINSMDMSSQHNILEGERLRVFEMCFASNCAYQAQKKGKINYVTEIAKSVMIQTKHVLLC